jgi:hypothetical protein
LLRLPLCRSRSTVRLRPVGKYTGSGSVSTQQAHPRAFASGTLNLLQRMTSPDVHDNGMCAFVLPLFLKNCLVYFMAGVEAVEGLGIDASFLTLLSGVPSGIKVQFEIYKSSLLVSFSANERT